MQSGLFFQTGNRPGNQNQVSDAQDDDKAYIDNRPVTTSEVRAYQEYLGPRILEHLGIAYDQDEYSENPLMWMDLVITEFMALSPKERDVRLEQINDFMALTLDQWESTYGKFYNPKFQSNNTKKEDELPSISYKTKTQDL